MPNVALTPKAVMLMTRLKRQLILNGVGSSVVEEAEWSYVKLSDICVEYKLEGSESVLAEISKEVHTHVEANTWSM